VLNERIQRAIGFATAAHEGQVDRSGAPYILHPLRVAFSLVGVAPEAGVIAALLHDVVEDTEMTLDDIDKVFGTYVAEIVDALTRRDGESYDDFIARVQEHPVATIVKIADIRDNLTRTESLPKSLAGRYGRALLRLDPELSAA
jgi:(p)ppGpp synthase/HD superfamily hydrolase